MQDSLNFQYRLLHCFCYPLLVLLVYAVIGVALQKVIEIGERYALLMRANKPETAVQSSTPFSLGITFSIIPAYSENFEQVTIVWKLFISSWGHIWIKKTLPTMLHTPLVTMFIPSLPLPSHIPISPFSLHLAFCLSFLLLQHHI